MTYLRNIWSDLRTSLWFLPSMIVVSASCLALVLLEIDFNFEGPELAQRWPRTFGAGAEGAREVLSVIAGSVITIAGVAFSITIVVLALASSQYSPRVLRNFMRDWQNQTVLGGFLGIFAYCLIVLRTVRGEDNDAFVPSLAILGSLALAFIGLGLLIFFIHHIASSIHTTSIVKSVYSETKHAIDEMYPHRLSHQPLNSINRTTQESIQWYSIEAYETGYIQSADIKRLQDLATQELTMMKMTKAVGDFVIEGNSLASVNRCPDQEFRTQINSAFKIGQERTLEQNVGYGIRQLVDVALKGLSPGINDTTTSLICLDYLGAILARMAHREIEIKPMLNSQGVGIIPRGATFKHFVEEAVTQIRQNGEKNPAVLLRILEVLANVLEQACDRSRIQILADQAMRISEDAKLYIPEWDRSDIEMAFKKFLLLASKKNQELASQPDREVSP